MFFGLCNIAQVMRCFVKPTVYMIVGMVANSMSFLYYGIKYIRMTGNIIANAKKRGFCIVFFEFAKYKGRNGWVRAIIKSQVYSRLIGWWNFPNQFVVKQGAEPPWRFNEVSHATNQQKNLGITASNFGKGIGTYPSLAAIG